MKYEVLMKNSTVTGAAAGWSRKLKGLLSSVKIGECAPTFSY